MTDNETPLSEAAFTREGEMLREACELAYRRGYQQGFEQAAHNVQTFKNGGTVRVQEVANVLMDHALGVLVDWRGEAENGDSYPGRTKPPRLWVSSWHYLKSEVYRRDGRQCQVCGDVKGPFEVDHIKPVHQGGLPTLENLRVSCRTCNRERPRGRAVR